MDLHESADIEDLGSIAEITLKNGYSSNQFHSLSVVKRQFAGSQRRAVDRTESISAESFIPGLHTTAVEVDFSFKFHISAGSKSIFMKTWGCSHNSSDSEYMAGQLSARGYRILTNGKESADLWVLNSCTVKGPAEQHLQNLIHEAETLGKSVVICGCVPQAAPRTPWLRGLSLLGVQQIDRIVEVVEETLKGNSVRLLGQKKSAEKRKLGGASLDLPKIRRNPFVEILAINTGCLNQCTYCKTKHARGDLGKPIVLKIMYFGTSTFYN